jgi:hypothetical protein
MSLCDNSQPGEKNPFYMQVPVIYYAEAPVPIYWLDQFTDCSTNGLFDYMTKDYDFEKLSLLVMETSGCFIIIQVIISTS